MRKLWWFVAVLLIAASPAAAQQPIRYTLSFPGVQAHYVDVEATIPTGGQRDVDLMMPVWTPGSYLVREYSRNVEALTAADAKGLPLRIEKTRKNRWRVSAGSTPAITLRYRVYAHELSVRTNWIDEEFGLLNGAATYITRLDAQRQQYEIQLRLPQVWSRSVSSLPSPSANTYQAPDFDTLVDSPILAGNPQIHDFTVAGKTYSLVDFAARIEWDGAKAVQDLGKVIEKTTTLWGVVPYERYIFFNILGGPNNGLEHKASTVLIAPRDSQKTRAGYLSWLGLASHEYFHAWNVKRLRPVELGPFDYENEVYTTALWFAEGVTDYYGDLQIHRGGVSTRDEYLTALSQTIASLQTTPGRLVQSASSASYDAWIKYYRPDENSSNASISYYTKGAVIGFLLDAEIRRETSGAKTLDDLMRALYAKYSGAKGFTSDEWRATALELVGSESAAELRRWFARALDSTEELDYSPALQWFGLEFKPAPDKPRPSLGVRTRTDGTKTIVTEVRRGSAAANAGLDINDEIVALGDTPLAGPLATALAPLAPGTHVALTISRRGETRRVDVTLGADETERWQLRFVPSPTAAQSAHAAGWLADAGK